MTINKWEEITRNSSEGSSLRGVAGAGLMIMDAISQASNAQILIAFGMNLGMNRRWSHFVTLVQLESSVSEVPSRKTTEIYVFGIVLMSRCAPQLKLYNLVDNWLRPKMRPRSCQKLPEVVLPAVLVIEGTRNIYTTVLNYIFLLFALTVWRWILPTLGLKLRPMVTLPTYCLRVVLQIGTSWNCSRFFTTQVLKIGETIWYLRLMTYEKFPST